MFFFPSQNKEIVYTVLRMQKQKQTKKTPLKCVDRVVLRTSWKWNCFKREFQSGRMTFAVLVIATLAYKYATHEAKRHKLTSVHLSYDGWSTVLHVN